MHVLIERLSAGSTSGLRFDKRTLFFLLEHETTFAMTVHKVQGSIFERVEVVLPVGDSRVLTRELLVTLWSR